jgi:hypothetical protein
MQIAALVTCGSITTRAFAIKIYGDGQSNRRIYSEKQAANWWPISLLSSGRGDGESD